MTVGFASGCFVKRLSMTRRMSCRATRLRICDAFSRFLVPRFISLLIKMPYALTSVQMPMAINPMPAMSCKCRSLTCSEIRPPASTPIAEVSTNAADAPTNTSHLLTSLSAANSKVASWVLSPSSARKTVVKTVKRIFQSILKLISG